jgi:hypothetical protein
MSHGFSQPIVKAVAQCELAFLSPRTALIGTITACRIAETEMAKLLAMLLLLVAASCAHSAPRQPASQPQAETRPATPEPAATPIAPAMPVAPATSQPATAAAPTPSETTPAPQAAGNASPPRVARPPAATAAAPTPNPAAPPVAAPKPAAPRVAAAPPPAAASPVAAPPAPVASPTLDLNALKEQLKETKAIGFFTKISLKNQVDDLMKQFREYYQGKTKLSLKQLRQSYDLLLMKVLSLLQDSDKKLASAIVSSREAIWGLLSDRKKFDALEI